MSEEAKAPNKTMAAKTAASAKSDQDLQKMIKKVTEIESEILLKEIQKKKSLGMTFAPTDFN